MRCSFEWSKETFDGVGELTPHKLNKTLQLNAER